MNRLLKTALVGTTKHPEIQLDAEHDVDALLATLAITDQEERLLLLAGARSLYQQAGWLPLSEIAPLSPSPPSVAPLRSPRLISLLHHVLQTQKHDLLIEFLAALRQSHVDLPYEVLPQALNITVPDVRQQLLPVLGERGRWLSQWNPSWEWATQGITAISDQDRSALRRAWEEGKLAQRSLALSVIRRADPAEGRRWLEETLPQEKDDARAELLEQLHNGLSADDEPLLERLLDDRSEQVKQITASLLKQLPASALVKRMTERAQSMLVKESNKLVANPPEELPKDWLRDGISAKVPTGRGKRSYWLEMALSAVPLNHWPRHLAMDPAILLAAINGDPYGEDVVQGWTRAIQFFTEDSAARLAWVHALWNYWLTRWQQDKKKSQDILSNIVVLLRLLPATTAEQNVLPFLVMGRLDIDALTLMLEVLPRPWSPAFANQYVKLARQVVKTGMIDQAYEWGKTLEIAARAMPQISFNQALAHWDVERPGARSWTATALVQLVERFIEIIEMRQLFFDELKINAKPFSHSMSR